MTYQHRPAGKQVQREVVDVLRWHRCTYEAEPDLDRRSQGAKGVATAQQALPPGLGRWAGRGLKAAVEASGITPWICQLLKELGVKVVVVNPNRVRLIAEVSLLPSRTRARF